MGELQIEGIYPLAYLRMITGQEVQQVFARTAAHFHQLYVDHGIDDLATVTLELTGQVKASLCLGRIGAASHPDIGEIKLHLVGTRGAAVISEARPEVGVYYRGQPPHEFRHRRIEVENDFFLLEDFARAIDTRSETILDARASRAIAATVEAALQSARTGDVVSVPPLPPCQVRL